MTLAAPGALTLTPARRSELPCSWLLCCAITTVQAALLVEAAHTAVGLGAVQFQSLFQSPKIKALGAGRKVEARAWQQAI